MAAIINITHLDIFRSDIQQKGNLQSDTVKRWEGRH